MFSAPPIAVGRAVLRTAVRRVTRLPHRRAFVVVFALAFVASAHAMPPAKMAWYQSQVPQAAVPFLKAPPTIDGKIGEMEWGSAVAFTGLQSQRDPYVLPDPLQGWVWAGYDAQKLYLAFRSPIPPAHRYAPKGLRAEVIERDASGKIEGEDHWEVRLLMGDPRKDGVTHIFLVNAKGTMSDQRVTRENATKRGNRHEAGLDWDSGAQSAASVGEKFWEAEMAIPLASLGYTNGIPRKTALRALIARGRTHGSMDNSAAEWNGAVAHFMSDQAGLLLFDGEQPAFQLLELGDLRGLRLKPVCRVANPGAAAAPVALRVAVESGAEVLHEEKRELRLLAGGQETVAFPEQALKFKEGMTGRVVVEATSGTNQLYRALIQTTALTPEDYRKFALPPYGVWPFPSPFQRVWGLKVASYPYFKSLDAWVDASFAFLPDEIKGAAKCELTLERKGAGAPIKSETVALKQRKAETHWESLDLPEGNYLLKGRLLSAEGRAIGDPVTREFIRKVFPWEHNTIGVSDKVFPPFQPMRTDAAKGVVSLWARDYAVGDCGLPGRIVATKEAPVPGQVIAGATRVEVTRDGKVEAFRGPGKVTASSEGRVTVSGEGESAGLKLSVESVLRYEGWWQCRVTVTPNRPTRIERLDLVLPAGPETDTMFTYRQRSSVYTGSIPPGKGEVWNNLKKSGKETENLFTPVIALGNGDAAFWWFAEGDEAWLLDFKQPSQLMTRDGDGLNLRQRLVNHPVEISKPLEFTFAIQTNPFAPDPPNRRLWMWGGNLRVHNTAGYGYWGTGVDSITAGSDEAYAKLKAAIGEWKARGSAERRAAMEAWAGPELVARVSDFVPVVLYNSGELLGPSMEEYGTFAGEWTGSTPLEFSPEYRDSDVHATVNFERVLTQDWRSRPLSLGPAFADLVPSCVDCRVWHYRQNMEKLGVHGYWFDNASIWPGKNVSTGRAYLAADGTMRPRYPTFARHELFRRMFVMNKEAGREPFSLVNQHTSFSFSQWQWSIEADSYVYGYGGDLFQTLEKSHEYDIISRVVSTGSTAEDPLARFRGHHRLRRIPGAMHSNLHPKEAVGIHGSKSVIGLALLHDYGAEAGVHEETLNGVRRVLKDFGFFTEPSVEFLPYWRNVEAVSFKPGDVKTSVFRNPKTGQLLAVLVNPMKTEASGELSLAVGASRGALSDPESRFPIESSVASGRATSKVIVPAHEYRLVLWSPTP